MEITLTAVTASIGAGLGIWNLVQGFWQRRVRLKVVPKLSVCNGPGYVSSNRDLLPNGFVCIEVTNLSSFPVTIAEVGFFLKGKAGRSVVIPDPLTFLPKRLESRESIDVRATRSKGFPKNAKKAFAKTQCDETRYGDSIVFKKHRKTAMAD
jgi:hypothetical protein